MDATTISAIAKQIVDQELIQNWKFYLILLAVTFVASAISSFAISYFRSRGQHFATKADFEELLSQVQQTTEATESIKQSLSHQDWVVREFKTLRRIKLEELLSAAYETHHWLDQCRSEALFSGAAVSAPNPSAKLEVIGGLYFPELKNELAAFRMAFLVYKNWMIESQAKVTPAKFANDAKAYNAAMDGIQKSFEDVHVPLLKCTTALEGGARSLMAEVLGVAS